MSELIGQQIGQYRVDALLGEGNMGAVYQAYDTNLARKVVLKVMHRQLASHESFQQRFMQEAQAAARLDHPSIIRLYNFGSEPSLFMVMEYISGPSLGDYVKHQQAKSDALNLDVVLRLIAQVADALDYAHDNGVIHRDIKPSNILLKPLSRPDRDGDPTLRTIVTDFGLAKLLEGGMHTLTGTFMGTLSYMSPEQCLGRDLDGRSDIYSLGIVLYQLATGQLPFNVKSPTDAIRMHVKELPPAPCVVRPGLPEVVEQVILQAIAKNPASRFQTGSQFAEALRRAAWLLVRPKDHTFHGSDVFAINGQNLGSAEESIIVDQLLIYHAGEAPRTMALSEEAYTVGRGAENNVILPDKGVSRLHLRLERKQDGWLVRDMDSTNGAFLDKVRLSPNASETWLPGTELRVGPYSLQWQKAVPMPAPEPVSAPEMPSVIAEPERPQTTSAGEVELVVDPATIQIEAGDRVNLQIMLINRGPIVEHVNVRLEQIPDEWVSYSEQLVKLMPGSRGFLRVGVAVPRNNSARSGSHPFRVVATPMSNPDAVVRTDCELVLKPFMASSMVAEPRLLRNKGVVELQIRNEGNAATNFNVKTRSAENALLFKPSRKSLRIEPGNLQSVGLSVEPAHRRLLGSTQREPFTVELWSSDEMIDAHQGELEIKPRVPAWFLISFVTIAIALSAFAVYFNFMA